ncbi:MAG: tetratricopeptide repeat protein, partial [Verrucomicrobiota bacterium]
LEKYPNSGMVPAALYQCALSEFMLDQLEPSLAKAERVIREFGGSELVASAWNLRGDIFATEGRSFEEVEDSYLRGKEVADRTPGQAETAAYSLWQLEIQTVEVEQWDKAAKHLAEFEERHPNSGYRLDFLAASLPTLVATGRAEEGLDRLRRIVLEYGDQPESQELAEMFGSYLEFTREHLSLEEAMKELEEFRLRPETSAAIDGWLRIGLIELLSDAGEEGEEKARQQFFQLHARFEPANQSNYVTVQLARWLARERGLPDEAKVLYDYILEERPGSSNYDYALVDTAELQANSSDPQQRQEAMQKYQKVLMEIPNEELRELATLGMARIHSKDEEFGKAKLRWEEYLDNREWTVSRPEANYQLAHCFDRLGNTSDALKIYVSVYANFPGHLDWSTRAYVRTAVILKEQGEDLKALLVLRDMIKRMGHHDHAVVTEAKKLFVTWRAEYVPEETEG